MRRLPLLLLALLLSACGRISFELREPVPLEELPALEAELGVPIVGFQHRHPGTLTTMTIGGGREPGESWGEAIERHRRDNAAWARERAEHPPGGARANDQGLEDFRAQLRHLEEHGAMVDLIYVAGPLEAMRVRGHPSVR